MTQYTSLATEMVDLVYRAADNYKVTEGTGSGVCYLFFSGNGLYFPNDEATFRKVVLEGHRFEWENVAKAKRIRAGAEKLIFVRDVYKRWYLDGISETYHSVDLLLAKLKELTAGLRVITVGNSAGAYMAILAGIKLRAACVYAFNPQISLRLVDPEDHPIVAARAERYHYADLSPLLQKSVVPIFFFYAALNEADCRHMELARGKGNVYFFPFREKRHGASVLSVHYPLLLSRPEELPFLAAKLRAKPVTAGKFLRKNAGFVRGVFLQFVGFCRKVRGKLARKSV